MDGAAIAGDKHQGVYGSKNEGPGRFVVSFRGRLSMVRMNLLQLVATLIEYEQLVCMVNFGGRLYKFTTLT